MKDKIPFYETVNMFFVGTVFSITLFILLFDKIQYSDSIKALIKYCEKWSVVIGVAAIAMMFEIGLILNKIGSLVLTPLLSKFKIWPRKEDYTDISEIEKERPKFRSLNIELHVIRTHIIMCIILSIVAIIVKKWFFLIAFIPLIVLFLFSCYKTNAVMDKIKNNYLDSKEGEQKNEE